MLRRAGTYLPGLTIVAAIAFASPALAQRGASCHNGMSFPQFLASLEQDAQKAGVSRRAIAEAAPHMVYDQGIVNRDRGQRVFGQLFTQFAGRMASEARRVRGQQLIRQHAQAFARAEKEYGVPAAVITA
ncbi:MAG: lytic murein transglycosylase, partial [Nitrobacter sp.]